MTQILKALEGYSDLFYDVVGPVATGAVAAVRVAVNAAYVVPSAARELVGVIPFIQAEAPAAGDSLLAIGDIIGPDFKNQPCEWLYPVGAGKLGALDEMPATPAEFWAIHAPMKGGEILNIGVEIIAALAGNGQAYVTMVFSTKPTGKKPIYGVFSAIVAGAAAGVAGQAIAGNNLTISNGVQMYELIAACVNNGVAVTLEEIASWCLMKCTVWDEIKSTQFFIAPVHAMVGATGNAVIKSLQRLPFDEKFTNPQATIETILYQWDVMAAVAPGFVHGFRYYGS